MKVNTSDTILVLTLSKQLQDKSIAMRITKTTMVMAAFIGMTLTMPSITSAEEKAPATTSYVLSIDGENISREYFDFLYNKSVSEVDGRDKPSRSEFLQQFINLKLKVAEAKRMGLDTVPHLRKEISNYREKLRTPLYNDTTIIDSIARIEYERGKQYINVSHILFRPASALPRDIELAKSLAQSTKVRLKYDEWDSIASMCSEDPSAKRNYGHLGWITAMTTNYDFETYIYDHTHEKGNISDPVLTSSGYHLIRINDVKPSQGSVLVGHIFKQTNDSFPSMAVSAQREINLVYDSLQLGADFAELVSRHSDDKSTADKGGVLPWFAKGQMIEQVDSAAFALLNAPKGSARYSNPFRSAFGWHIIKLLDHKPYGTYEEMKNQIYSFIAHSDRTNILRHATALKAKSSLGFKANEFLITKLKNIAKKNDYNDSTFIAKAKNMSEEVIATFKSDPTTKFTVSDLCSTLNDSHLPLDSCNTMLLQQIIDGQTDKMAIDLDHKLIDRKNPEIQYLIEEYSDGSLVFEASKKLIWDKASNDTTGLKHVFEQNKDRFRWDKPHFKGRIFFCDNKALYTQINNVIKSSAPSPHKDLKLNKIYTQNRKRMKVSKGLFAQGTNADIDKVCFTKGGEQLSTQGYSYGIADGIIIDQPTSYHDVRGQVVLQYQEDLEKLWLQDLHKRHKIVIYQTK